MRYASIIPQLGPGLRRGGGMLRASHLPRCFPAKAGTQSGLPPSRENKEAVATSPPRQDHHPGKTTTHARQTTPAEAGAQLGDGADLPRSSITDLHQLGPSLRRGGGNR